MREQVEWVQWNVLRIDDERGGRSHSGRDGPMSRARKARRVTWVCGVFWVTLLLVASSAGAEEPRGLPPLLGGNGASAVQARRFLQRLVEREAARGEVLRSRLASLRAVVAALGTARKHAAALQEGRALAALARARARIQDLADVPGAARWWAEVEATVAVVAHQAGRPTLIRQALDRLASLAPGRDLLPGEAPPELIQRARSLRAARAVRSPGWWRVVTSPPGAMVFLDDEPVGRSPLRVRIPAGWHVLRLSAPGHLSWGRAVRVEPGREVELQVSLVPTPALRAGHVLVASSNGGEEASGAAGRAALEALDLLGREGYPARWVHLRRRDGGWDAFGCDGRGCIGPLRAGSRREGVASVLGSLAGARRVTFDVLLDRWDALLRTPLAPLAAAPRRAQGRVASRWVWWAAAVGVAAVGAGVGAWWLWTRSEGADGPRPVRVRFEPGVPLPREPVEAP